MKKVAFYTLGCKLNYSETSSIGRLFEDKGYKKVEFHEEADIYVINTCSVTDNADKKCKKVVKEALKHSPNAFITIVGCYAQLKPEEIATIPGVDAVLGAAEKFKLLDLLDTFEKKDKATVYASDIAEANTFHHAHSINDRTRTFLKVQDGCDYNCSFCTIPLARGNSRSDRPENIVQKAKEIGLNGIKEIVLTGVNIGDYGIIDGKRVYSFLDLIKQLDEVEEIERFRISSIEPNLLSNEIIEFVAQSKRFVPHFHIPLQSGNDKLLAAMRRRYRSDLYLDRVAKIKGLMPECCIGVDVIVGFPGETEEEFLVTYNFLNELDISYLHVFSYSERDNTLAPNLPGTVTAKDKDKRSRMLRTLSEKKKRYFYQQHIGKSYPVLFENEEDNGLMYGFTPNYIKTQAKYDPILTNDTKVVTLTGITADNIVEITEHEEVLSH